MNEVGCNNVEALFQAFKPGYLISTNHAHFDLLYAIQGMIKVIPLCWKSRHVKGHQDNDTSTPLDRWARLNVEVDYLAQKYWQETQDIPLHHQQRIRAEGWTVWLGKKKVCS